MKSDNRQMEVAITDHLKLTWFKHLRPFSEIMRVSFICPSNSLIEFMLFLSLIVDKPTVEPNAVVCFTCDKLFQTQLV